MRRPFNRVNFGACQINHIFTLTLSSQRGDRSYQPLVSPAISLAGLSAIPMEGWRIFFCTGVHLTLHTSWLGEAFRIPTSDFEVYLCPH
jgi:hypothetical protein